MTIATRPGKRPVQMVFQDPFASLNPRLNVAQLLAEPAIANGQRQDGAERENDVPAGAGRSAAGVADAFRISSLAANGSGSASRALMLNPDVVVLDEAVSALDVSVQARCSICSSTCSASSDWPAIFISHDMAVVERIAHRIAVMFAGEIVEIGRAANVLSAPQHGYTKRLIAAVPAVDRRKAALCRRYEPGAVAAEAGRL